MNIVCPDFQIDGKVYCFRDRSIIRVTMAGGEVQPFYRSTGRNSGMAGEWLPFDGLQLYPVEWFDKTRFSDVSPETKRGGPLYRYGTAELKAASEALGHLTISKGRNAAAQTINKWLATPRALKWWRANQAFLDL